VATSINEIPDQTPPIEKLNKSIDCPQWRIYGKFLRAFSPRRCIFDAVENELPNMGDGCSFNN
jgi:hypothetical protein